MIWKSVSRNAGLLSRRLLNCSSRLNPRQRGSFAAEGVPALPPGAWANNRGTATEAVVSVAAVFRKSRRFMDFKKLATAKWS
jgi:hypothetical protein